MGCCSANRAGLEVVEEENCDDCRTWEEEFYWKHFQPLHFCQILGLDGEFHKQLVIPKKFANNAWATLHPEVTLRGPSGASWCAILTMRGDDMFLTGEWEEFVRAYSLQEGNILIFKYDGISVFDVLIFDGDNLCEKESAYFVQKCDHANLFAEHERKRVSSEADLEEHNGNHVHRATKLPREEVGKKKTPKRSNYSHLYGRSRRKRHVPRKFVSSKANLREKVPLASSENLSGPHDAPSNQEPQNNAKINENCATEAPNENEDHGTFATEAPIETEDHGTFAIEAPNENEDHGTFATEAPNENEDHGTFATEAPNENEDHGTFATEAPNENEDHGTFATEAPPHDAPLINGNCLIEFEAPQETPQITGNFYIEASPQTGGETDGRCTNEATPQKTTSARPGRKRALGSEKEEASVSSRRIQTKSSSKKVTSSVGRPKRQLGATKAAEASPFVSVNSPSRKYTSEGGKKALEMAQKQMTESSFVALMRPTGVSHRFVVTVPTSWYKQHLSPNSQDVYLRLGDKTWLTTLWYSPSKGTGYISGGWKQFVLENQLEEHDVCLFNFASQKDDRAMLDVSIFRAGSKMTG